MWRLKIWEGQNFGKVKFYRGQNFGEVNILGKLNFGEVKNSVMAKLGEGNILGWSRILR